MLLVCQDISKLLVGCGSRQASCLWHRETPWCKWKCASRASDNNPNPIVFADGLDPPFPPQVFSCDVSKPQNADEGAGPAFEAIYGRRGSEPNIPAKNIFTRSAGLEGWSRQVGVSVLGHAMHHECSSVVFSVSFDHRNVVCSRGWPVPRAGGVLHRPFGSMDTDQPKWLTDSKAERFTDSAAVLASTKNL